MARKRLLEPPADGGALILPLRLVERKGLSATEYRIQCKDQARWFSDRGIDPGDWSVVYPVLLASWKGSRHRVLAGPGKAPRNDGTEPVSAAGTD